MNKAILDASALIAFVRKERGHEIVREWIVDSAISAVNFAEVMQKLGNESVEEKMLRSVVQNLSVQVVAFDREHAIIVGKLYPNANKGISLADRACISLGITLNLPILTADREWQKLGLGANIIQFRPELN